MRTQEEVLSQFVDWARRNDMVRAAILTSTRANPNRETDVLSDYDIEFYVLDLEPFRRDDQWLTHFGEIVVRWPFKPRATGEKERITRLVIFKDAVRIDFQIHEATDVAPNAYDDDYKVLLDKDGLLAELNPPTLTEHLTQKPSEGEYETLVNEFWWNAHYVPKYLWREELPFAASMLGQAVRDKYLRTIIDWSIGLRHDWAVNTGVFGKKFKPYLDDRTWSEYESTFAGARLEENWEAFFNAVALFRRLAKRVGESLGYEYPSQVDREMTEYYQWIKCLERKSAAKAVQVRPEDAPGR